MLSWALEPAICKIWSWYDRMTTIEKYDIFLTQNNVHMLTTLFQHFFSETFTFFVTFLQSRPSDVRRTTAKMEKKQMAQMGNRHENFPTNTCQKKNNLLLTLGVRKKNFTFLDHIFELL